MIHHDVMDVDILKLLLKVHPSDQKKEIYIQLLQFQLSILSRLLHTIPEMKWFSCRFIKMIPTSLFYFAPFYSN